MKINPLTPKWQHNDPDVRLQSVQSGKLSSEILTKLASDDDDDRVRRAAIERLDDQNTLLNIANSAQSVSPEAAIRWASLVGADLAHIDVVNSELSGTLIKALAIHAPTEDFRLRATEQLTNDDALLEILLCDNLSRVHQHCAGRLEDEAALRKVQQHFLDRDKNVTRIVKSKLQVLNQTRAEQTEREAMLTALLDKLEQLVNGETGPDYGRRVDVLKHQWLALADDPYATPYRNQMSELIAKGETIAAAIPDPREIRKQVMAELVVRCEQLTAECQASPQVDNLTDRLADIVSDWPEDEQTLRQQWLLPLTTLANVQRRWQDLLLNRASMNLAKFKTQLSELEWPEGFPKPANFDAVAAQVDAELQEKAAHSAELEAAQAELQQLADKFETEVSAGHIKAANRVSAKLSKLLESTRPSGELAAHIQQLMAKLQELKDWQGFATQPKRDELCDKMKHLAEDDGIPPPEKAIAIKELQDEWKKLGPSDSRAAQKSWSRFKKLGDQAFAPCAVYFAEQEQIRQQNLEQREKICASLELINAQQDWDGTDWKAMADILHKAKSEWRQYSNVPRRQKKAIDKRFDQALGPIQDRIKQEQSVNVDKKRALIQEVTDLLESDTNTTAIVEATKAIQQKWKQIGLTDRRQDQKLWKAFRSQCDAVFNRRDEDKQAAKQVANETATQFRDLCRQFQQRLDSDAPIAKSDISAFRKDSAAIRLEPQQRGLQAEASKLIKVAEKQLKQQVEANQEQMFREFQRRNQLLDQVDQGALSAADAEQQYDSSVSLDSALSDALLNRSERTFEEQELLLIRLEILADLPSPEASQPARMAYQVQRLNRELSQGVKETRSEREQVQELLMSWFATSAKADQLNTRFQQVAIKLGLPV